MWLMAAETVSNHTLSSEIGNLKGRICFSKCGSGLHLIQTSYVFSFNIAEE